MIRARSLSRQVHRWLGLFIGLQVLIWLLSGLYMVVVDLDFIHGDPLVHNTREPLSLSQDASRISVNEILLQYPNTRDIELKRLLGKLYFSIETPGGVRLVDAENGAPASPLPEAHIRLLANHYFKGVAPIGKVELLTQHAPSEIGNRPLPLWRVDFDDRFATSFYIHPDSGELVTRRHRWWRVFDVMWMLHIMDYEERSDAHNRLLVFTELLGLALGLSGAWFLYHRLRRPRPRRKAP